MRRQAEWGNCDMPIITQEQMQNLLDTQEKAINDIVTLGSVPANIWVSIVDFISMV